MKSSSLPRPFALIAAIGVLLPLAHADARTDTDGGNVTLLHRYEFENGVIDSVGWTQPRPTIDGEATEAPERAEQTPPGIARGAPDASIRLGASAGKTSGWFIPADPVRLSRGSFSLWIRPDSALDGQVYILNAPPLESGVLLKGQGRDERIKLGVAGEGLISMKGAIQANQWHHVAATWDAENGEASLFLNGREIASNDSPAPGEIRLSPDHALRVGNWGPGQGEKTTENQFRGLIYDLQIYSGRLTPAEIEQLYDIPGSAIRPRSLSPKRN